MLPIAADIIPPREANLRVGGGRSDDGLRVGLLGRDAAVDDD